MEGIEGILDAAGLDETDKTRVEEAASALKDGLTGVEEEVLQTRSESFYDPLDDKPYRHATHYQLPEEVNNM